MAETFGIAVAGIIVIILPLCAHRFAQDGFYFLHGHAGFYAQDMIGGEQRIGIAVAATGTTDHQQDITKTTHDS